MVNRANSLCECTTVEFELQQLTNSQYVGYLPGSRNSATAAELGFLRGPLVLADQAAEDRPTLDPLPGKVGDRVVGPGRGTPQGGRSRGHVGGGGLGLAGGRGGERAAFAQVGGVVAGKSPSSAWRLGRPRKPRRLKHESRGKTSPEYFLETITRCLQVPVRLAFSKWAYHRRRWTPYIPGHIRHPAVQRTRFLRLSHRSVPSARAEPGSLMLRSAVSGQSHPSPMGDTFWLSLGVPPRP